MFVIEDEAYGEQIGEFSTMEAAVTELQRLRAIAWTEAPNIAPCTSWRTRGRRYELIEYDSSATPWREERRLEALTVSAEAVEWLLPFGGDAAV